MRGAGAETNPSSTRSYGPYDTGVTLRQLFYRLVADGTLVNKFTSYQQLAARTAEARRNGSFPELVDGTRSIWQPFTFQGPQDVRDWLRGENGYEEPAYRLDRTEGQPYNVLLAVEKSTLQAQFVDWFEDRGLPIVALRGYSSTPLLDAIRDGDYDLVLYVGDFDPTGEDIQRNLTDRTGALVHRVTVTRDQIRPWTSHRCRGNRLILERLGLLPATVNLFRLRPRRSNRTPSEPSSPPPWTRTGTRTPIGPSWTESSASGRVCDQGAASYCINAASGLHPSPGLGRTRR